jgi:hypothetical protein
MRSTGANRLPTRSRWSGLPWTRGEGLNRDHDDLYHASNRFMQVKVDVARFAGLSRGRQYPAAQDPATPGRSMGESGETTLTVGATATAPDQRSPTSLPARLRFVRVSKVAVPSSGRRSRRFKSCHPDQFQGPSSLYWAAPESSLVTGRSTS